MGSKPWTQADLNAYSMQKNISIEDLAARMNFAASHHQQQLLSPSDVQVYALRIRNSRNSFLGYWIFMMLKP
jgi:hypothetical protein